jgi:hypothetical protein
MQIRLRMLIVAALAAAGCAGVAVDGDGATESSLTAGARWTTVSNGVAPANLYVGGQEPGRTLGVCIAAYNGGTHGGKVIGGNCNIGWGGNEVSLSQYQALTNVAAGTDVWVAGSNGGRPADALPSGAEGSTQQYVCRASYGGGTHPGKLLGSNCNIGWGGKEITVASYEVLALRATSSVTVTAFQAQPIHFSPENWRQRDVSVIFPANGSVRTILHLALGCPDGGCDAWDRFGTLGLVTHAADGSEAVVEIARFMTPYGVGGSWDFDVTDLRPLLTGSVTLRAFIDTWVGPGNSAGAGWLVTASFELIPGAVSPTPVVALPIWTQRDAVYGDPSRPIASAVPPQTLTLPDGVSSVAVRTFVTGHGQGNRDNCAEFCARNHTVRINGVDNRQLIWRDDCAQNPISNQGGNWQPSRAGWCPGADVRPWTVQATPTSRTLSISYDVDAYENTCRPSAPVCQACAFNTSCDYDGGLHTEPHYTLSSLLIGYR